MARFNVGKSLPRPTKQYHGTAYDKISPSRPELSVKGQTVMVTGGATGIGFETTRAFAQAGAGLIILLARSEGPMNKAKQAIEADYPGTKVSTYAVSISDTDRVTAIVNEVGTIDILVLNAGMMHKPGPVLNIDPTEAQESFQTNVLGPWNLVRAFVNLAPRTEGAHRTIINTSTAGITSEMQGTSIYNASKGAFTYLTRHFHAEHKDAGVRVFSFHPAVAFTPMARDVMGFTEEQFEFDSLEVPAHFAVWLCSPEADFLKGKFVHAQWDIDELKSKKDILDNDPTQLQIGLVMDKLVT